MFHCYFSFFDTFFKNVFLVKTHYIIFSVLVLIVLFIWSPQINVFYHAFIQHSLMEVFVICIHKASFSIFNG